MQCKNTDTHFGFVSIFFHWITAFAVFGLFPLGLWMVSLDYYHAWYHKAPELHISIGLLCFMLIFGRILWRQFSPNPSSLNQGFTKKTEWLGQLSLHGVLLMVMFSGYLIFTADGRAVSFFGLFEMPATITSIQDQEDVAGKAHELLSYLLILLVTVHALVSLWRHFVVKDNALKRILGCSIK